MYNFSEDTWFKLSIYFICAATRTSCSTTTVYGLENISKLILKLLIL